VSRIINTQSVGKERNQLLKAIVISIRELMKQSGVNENTRDLSAFISRALLAVHATVERSVGPWEKRGYWVKADKFRLEWAWTKTVGEEMVEAVLNEDWGIIAAHVAAVGERLKNIEVSERHRMGKPWVGAWQLLLDEQKENN
jgi:hypothetical protein